MYLKNDASFLYLNISVHIFHNIFLLSDAV